MSFSISNLTLLTNPCSYLPYYIILGLLGLILLTGFTDLINKVIGRKIVNDDLKEAYAARHLKGLNDGRIVDLSFFNTSINLDNPDPERPSKIIFDKNDPSGNLLPLLFPQYRGYLCHFLRNGTLYVGINNPSFSYPTHGTGVLERVDTDTYFITVLQPNPVIIQELNNRNISVLSRNLPLRSVSHRVESRGIRPNFVTYIYIYANRRDAIGVFNPSDPTILPSS